VVPGVAGARPISSCSLSMKDLVTQFRGWARRPFPRHICTLLLNGLSWEGKFLTEVLIVANKLQRAMGSPIRTSTVLYRSNAVITSSNPAQDIDIYVRFSALFYASNILFIAWVSHSRSLYQSVVE
jgi:hypothetical protein